MSRRLSEDSLHDPNFPDPASARASSSQARRRSSASSQSSGTTVEAEPDEWTRAVSQIQEGEATGGSQQDALSPRAQSSSTITRPAVVRASSAELSPTATSRAIVPSPVQWGVEISPTRTATFRPPEQAAPGLAPTAEVDLESEDEEEHMPSFASPAPSPTRPPRPPAPSLMSPPRSPTRPLASPTRASRPPPPLRSSMRASLSIPTSRPLYTSSNSQRPLLSDSSAVNTPMSPLADPFASPLASAGAQLTVPTVPSIAVHHSGSASDPPRIHINSIPNSPADSTTGLVSPALPIPFSSPFGTIIPTAHDASHEQARSSFSDSPGPQRRSSVANTHRSAQSIAQSVTQSITSALGSPNGKLTMAERRNQRMKQVMGKKGRKERDSKVPGGVQINRKPFQSTRLKEEIYKPWLEKKDPAQRWARWITLLSVLVGLGVMGVICWDGYNSVPRLGNTCSVLTENFANGIDSSVWTREVRVDGYGHGSFEYTTASNNNSFVQDGILYLVPTLTSDVLGEGAIQNGYTLNLTQDGTCTSNNVSQCVAVSNTSQLTVINPVMSARLTTRMSVNVQYGKVEVVARFPTGDWLWPSISMFPVNQTYGKGPRSGEIDIITGRGNNASYTQRGVDYAQSTLHWGPTNELDRSWMTWGYREQRRSSYNQGFRTFGFEWNENYLWTYIDSRVAQVVSLRFDQSFWNRGKFPSTITNTTTGDVVRLTNPWINSNNNNAPFDQPLYLTLSLGVGGTDGWFPDGEGGKPWLDNSLSAMSDFWNAKNRWWSNWPSDPTKRGFAIKSVKMWKTC